MFARTMMEVVLVVCPLERTCWAWKYGSYLPPTPRHRGTLFLLLRLI